MAINILILFDVLPNLRMFSLEPRRTTLEPTKKYQCFIKYSIKNHVNESIESKGNLTQSQFQF